jgi:hypothetical protein
MPTLTREQVTPTAAQVTYVRDGYRYCVWVMTRRTGGVLA